MDIHSPDLATDPAPGADTPSPISRIFHKCLMKQLAAAIPGDTNIHSEEWAEKWDQARELYDALAPAYPAEAALAAFAVAAFQGAMDSLARAARPGVSDEKAGRLRGGALAAGRAYSATLRYLRKQRADAAPPPAPTVIPKPPEHEPAPPGFFRLGPDDPPIPDCSSFQPRDRLGKPIPLWRFQDMTMAQRRATYCFPRKPELEAVAIAEEEAMIAEQAAQPEPASTA